MKETILYIAVTLLLIFLCIRSYFDIKNWVKRKVSRLVDEKLKTINKENDDRFRVAYLSLEKKIERLFFEQTKNNSFQNEKNNLAKKKEVLQDKQDEPSKQADIWQNLEQLRRMRDLIDQGNQEDYRNINQLSNLPPLDAWREIDSRIAEIESVSQHPAAAGNQTT